jgi:hypothetical protein
VTPVAHEACTPIDPDVVRGPRALTT